MKAHLSQLRLGTVAKRHISLVSPTAATLVPAQIAQKLDVEPLFGCEQKELEVSQFRVLGQPATLCSMKMPAGVALYVRRGCIVSLHGAGNDNSVLSMSHDWVGLAWSLAKYGSWRTALFHRLVVPKAFDALVAPNVASNRLATWLGAPVQSFRTLCLLDLDGTQDWCVFGKNSLIAYEGNTSLQVNHSSLWPSWLQWKSESALPSTYRLLQGRGNALLSGTGSVYTVELPNESEELVLSSEHLLAISGSSPRDIARAVSEYRFLASPLPSAPEAPSATLTAGSTPQTSFLHSVATTSKNALSWVKRVYVNYINGSSKYLCIRGPRFLLVQTSHRAFLPTTTSTSPKSAVSSGEKAPISSSTSDTTTSKDYLSYVTVGRDGNVQFQSTSDFSKEVAEIEAAKRK